MSHHTLHSNIKVGRNIVTLEAGWKESMDGIKLVSYLAMEIGGGMKHFEMFALFI